ncbi:MAG: ABC transporter permease [Lachnospiraceae bacterium]|nr:ABC transporter permease [Lachnospiraceae bacterium]MBQ1516193.1 ABC transporter permease [Lachnospiraceae bacterium]
MAARGPKNEYADHAGRSARPARSVRPARHAWVWPIATLIVIILAWQLVSTAELVPSFMLPSPVKVAAALVSEFPLLLAHSRVTIVESAAGLALGVLIGFGFAVLMDRFDGAYRALYPLIVISQTIPTVAIAPLLVLWFGYGLLPKVVLIIIVTFFPMTVSMLSGFREADPETIDLLRSMGASRAQIFRHVKFPGALGSFFSALRICVSYAVVGAVISEWLGGFEGLGVYMTRVKSAFAFDKMFAVIVVISVVSLILMGIVSLAERRLMPWTHIKERTSET